MPEALQTPQLAPDDIAGNHNILADDFTKRYIKRAHIPLLAKAQRYDINNPFCGYDQTFWPAMPNEHSELAAKVVLGGFFKMLPGKMHGLFYEPFAERVDEIADTLHKNPLLVVTGHSPDLLAALPVHGISKAVAKNQPGDYLQNLYDIIKESHAVGTRGFVPLRFRLPPPIKPENKFLVRAAQLVFSVHFTFPRTETMRESGISLEFIDEYNARARADCLTAVQQPSQHPDGLKQVWGMAPSGAPDLKGENLAKKYPDAPPDLKIIRAVSPGTTKLIRQMGVSLLHASASFGPNGIVFKLGEIIPPNEVTDDTVRDMLFKEADLRRINGETTVRYEEEDEILAYAA